MIRPFCPVLCRDPSQSNSDNEQHGKEDIQKHYGTRDGSACAVVLDKAQWQNAVRTLLYHKRLTKRKSEVKQASPICLHYKTKEIQMAKRR